MLRKFATVKLASVITTEDDYNKALTGINALAASKAAGDYNVQKIVRYNPEFVYARFKAIGSIEVDGPNANADAFPYGEFLDNRPNYGYQSFIGKHAYVEHASDNINNSIGDLYHSYLNRFNTDKFGGRDWSELPDEQRMWTLANRNSHEDGSIEVLMAVDKKLAPKIARMLETGSPTGCSMGTNIDYSECTVCGNRAYVEEQYCPHIKFSKGQRVLVPASQISDLIKKGAIKPEWLPHILSRPSDFKHVKAAGRNMVYARAFEVNYGLSFFELSIVANPAFAGGYKLEKIASAAKPAVELRPLIRINDGKVVETIFKVSSGYFDEMMGTRSTQEKQLLQRSGEVARNALMTANVHEVLVANENAPYFMTDQIELTAAETAGFYKLSNPETLLEKKFANTRDRNKIGVVGTVEEKFYACAECSTVFDRQNRKFASTRINDFETFSICPDCEQAGIQHTGDNTMSNPKKANCEGLPTTSEFTGDKEVVKGEGAFVGEKKDLYESWAENGSKQIEKEKEYRPMGTIFTDPIVAKHDLNSRSTRIGELTKSAATLLARVKLAMGDPNAFMEEMGKGPEMGMGMGMGMGPGPEAGPMGDDPFGGPGMDDGMGIAIEFDMTPQSAPEVLENTKADLEMILNDLQMAQELVGTRETEATQALVGKVRWGRRFVEAATKTAEEADTLIADAESAVQNALAKVQKACDIICEAESDTEVEQDNDTESKPKSSESDKKSDKPDFDKEDKTDNTIEGDDAMAKESKLELNAGNIELLRNLRDAFSSNSVIKALASDDDDADDKKEDSDGDDAEDKKDEGKKKKFPFEKDSSVKTSAAMPPTGAKDPGDYGQAGAIESHEMNAWWNKMAPEFTKMKSTEQSTSFNDPEGRVELLTGPVGNYSPDNPEVGKQTMAPAIFAKFFNKRGPKWANSFIGVVKTAENGSTEAFTANFHDVAGEDADAEAFDTFASPEYLDKVVATVKTQGMNTAYHQMSGKIAQLEGITPGKTEKVNPLYDTKEENKHSNTPRKGETPDAKDGHGKQAGDKEYYGKAYGDGGYASDLTTANTKIAALASKVEKMENEKRSAKLAEYALHMARIAASRGIIPFDLPNIQKQAMEYIQLDEKGLQAVKGHLDKLQVTNRRALEAYQIPEAENMSNGVIHNNLNVVDKVRMEHTQAENVAPDGIQTAVEQDAKVTADQAARLRKQASDMNNVVPQMHANASDTNNGIPDVTKYFNTIENQLKRKGVYEQNAHYLRSNRR